MLRGVRERRLQEAAGAALKMDLAASFSQEGESNVAVVQVEFVGNEEVRQLFAQPMSGDSVFDTQPLGANSCANVVREDRERAACIEGEISVR